MKEYIDQMNLTIRLGKTPRRIVSLVPSQTQLLHALGMEEEVVGITKFCIHPGEWFRSKERVGGTKSVDLEKVKSLQPDLIIGNKEENSQEDIEALREIAPVWMSDIYSLEDAMIMLRKLGGILDKQSEVVEMETNILHEFEKLKSDLRGNKTVGKSVYYFIWKDPDFLSGKMTFIDDMLTRCGFVNATNKERYPEANPKVHPDFVFLSSEPYPFQKKHISEFQEKYPNSKIVLVDGEMFSWYGSKLLDAPRYFAKLLQSLEE